jgi:hypothetical protein
LATNSIGFSGLNDKNWITFILLVQLMPVESLAQQCDPNIDVLAWFSNLSGIKYLITSSGIWSLMYLYKVMKL